MNNTAPENHSKHYSAIETALCYLAEHWSAQPSLTELAEKSGYSPHHLSRLFHDWCGIPSKQFLKLLTRDHALSLLNRGESVETTALELGLSGPARLHDLTLSLEAATPGEIKSGGEGLTLYWGVGETPFGGCFIAFSNRGLCAMEFLQGDHTHALEALQANWPKAKICRDHRLADEQLSSAFNPAQRPSPLRLWVKGTQFQLKVWEALLAIPSGSLSSYSEIANRIGNPGAARAVGSAIGNNPISWLIPCHRVIQRLGTLGGYRWGLPRKVAMIGWEGARLSQSGLAESSASATHSSNSNEKQSH